MLLFIFKTVAGLIGQKHFKTSHVIVYLHGLYCGYTAGLFQNISCYCLSEKQELATRQKFHFKTSHVIVYRAF